jgi:two-component system phosphate regulon sensor histidine kinase PhoR
MNATLAVLVVVAVLVVAVLAMSLRRAQSRVYQARAETAQTQRQLERLQSEASSLRAGQMTIGAVATDALLTLDAERRVTWANQVALKLFGEPVGKTLIEVTRSHELEVFIAEAPNSVEPLTRQVVLNGQPFSTRAARLPTGGMALALQDVSELQRLGRARREFVANISHELRTPLASIRLLADTLQAGALSNPAIAPDMLSKINAEVDVLSQLARELLDLALIESGQMPLKLAPTDLHDLAQAQVERFSPQAQQKRLTLLMDIAPGTLALADGEMIGRVLSNLLHNACKFTPSGGQVSLTARHEGENVIVSIADTGPGIPPNELNRVFERFYKVDRARGQSGTGLGLAIARHIVEGHGGRIWAESAPGHGATFRFNLPAG